ncbi:MAG: hypothetical protein R2780_08190 [Crocinitomicaceae bacterium]
MKSVIVGLYLSLASLSFSQMYFSDMGSDPAYCRTSGSQSPGGVAWALATGGTAPINYLWESLATGATWTYTTWPNIAAGLYKITATDYYGTSIIDTVEVDSINPTANFAASGTGLTGGGVIYYGTAPVDVTFQNLSFGIVNPNSPSVDTTFYWQFTQFISFTQVNGYDSQVYTYSYSGDWGVTLVAENANGCIDTAYIQIFLDGPAGIGEVETQETKVFVDGQNICISYPGQFSQKTIKIYDLGGKMIDFRSISSNFETFSWNYGKGVFLYEIVNTGEAVVESRGKLTF